MLGTVLNGTVVIPAVLVKTPSSKAPTHACCTPFPFNCRCCFLKCLKHSVKQRLWQHLLGCEEDERLLVGQVDLAPQQMEVLCRCRHIGDTQAGITLGIATDVLHCKTHAEHTRLLKLCIKHTPAAAGMNPLCSRAALCGTGSVHAGSRCCGACSRCCLLQTKWAAQPCQLCGIVPSPRPVWQSHTRLGSPCAQTQSRCCVASRNLETISHPTPYC